MWCKNLNESGLNFKAGFDCLVVCLGLLVPLEKFFHLFGDFYRERATNFDLYSALMAIEQWEFFNVPHLLWHGQTLYKVHLQRPVILTPIAERLAEELSLPVLTT